MTASTLGKRYSAEEVAQRVRELEGASAEAILKWALDEFGSRISLACSFGAEDMVLVDLLVKIDKQARIFLLDTGRLHQETYELVEQARQHYGINFEVHFPQTEAAERLLREKGPSSFYESIANRKECCTIRKVEPLGRALSTVDAWITGLRRAQSTTRTEMSAVEIDAGHGGILKINPLIEWSEEQVWAYIKANGVPYNKLHDQNFPSIGCAPCTRAVQPGEDVRAGRWWWETPEQKECGLHAK